MRYQYDMKIAKLISKEISGEIYPDEKQELSEWIHALPENQALYNRIRNLENFKLDELQKINTELGWERIFPAIERANRIVHLRKLFRYASGVLIPLLIFGGASFYYSQQESEVGTFVQVHEILPGKTKAVLVLDNGKSVALDSSNDELITEKDGTRISRGAKSLNYAKNENKNSLMAIYNTIKIPQGGEYNLVLADGTHVYLNSESQLKYPVQFAEGIREVEFRSRLL
jgi:transmembrane sensor